MEQIDVMHLARTIQTEADAYAYLEGLRWNGHPVCPHCGNDERIYFLNPANGTSRKTRTGAKSQRRVWKCGACRKQFSVLTGTIFHGTKVSIHTWLMVIFEMCASKNGVSAREVERKYDLTPKTAWHMLHRIREAMKREPLVGMLSGTVQADETFVGGKPRNRHGSRKGKYGAGGRADLPPKTIVVSLVDEAGEMRSKIIPDITGATLRKAIAEQVDMPATVLHTDALASYKMIASDFEAHEYVDHSEGEYVRGAVTTNRLEGYFSQLKRSIDGTHHHVSAEHLPRYLAEFDYRYSTRKLSDTERMRGLVGQVEGRRLTYKPLTDS